MCTLGQIFVTTEPLFLFLPPQCNRSGARVVYFSTSGDRFAGASGVLLTNRDDLMRDSTWSSTRTLLSTLVLGVLALLLAGCGGPNLFERIGTPYWGVCGTLIIVLDIVALIDLLGDERREFSSKLIWTLLIVFFPVGGLILYYFFGR
jgi:hypothetical protein